MALTVGSIGKMVPYVTADGSTYQASIPMAMAASVAINPGDIVIESATDGKVTFDNDAASGIIGVAMDKYTTGASVTDSDTVNVALATPGRIFIANLVTDLTTDITPANYANLLLGDHANWYDFDEDTVSGYVVILANAGLHDSVHPIAFAAEQIYGPARYTVSTTINPRVYFHFSQTLTIFLVE